MRIMLLCLIRVHIGSFYILEKLRIVLMCSCFKAAPRPKIWIKRPPFPREFEVTEMFGHFQVLIAEPHFAYHKV